MIDVLIIGLGGFLGAVARYGLAGLGQRLGEGPLPLGTLLVNLLGCLLIGGLMQLVEFQGLLAPRTRLFLLIGFIGSFTTFSTFAYETFELLRGGEGWWALFNALAQTLGGFLLVWVGWLCTRWVLGA